MNKNVLWCLVGSWVAFGAAREVTGEGGRVASAISPYEGTLSALRRWRCSNSCSREAQVIGGWGCVNVDNGQSMAQELIHKCRQHLGEWVGWANSDFGNKVARICMSRCWCERRSRVRGWRFFAAVIWGWRPIASEYHRKAFLYPQQLYRALLIRASWRQWGWDDLKENRFRKIALCTQFHPALPHPAPSSPIWPHQVPSTPLHTVFLKSKQNSSPYNAFAARLAFH